MSGGSVEIAPDGSTVRVLARTPRASVIHCCLPPGGVSRAVRHRSVEEIWYCLRGIGQLWRSSALATRTDTLAVSAVFTIAPETCFQFRNDGAEPLEILITTIPPWPGNDEAQAGEPHWPPNL
jgi:mannose-6-phosphate isomerase-like protein (cupin superfamily)